MQEKVEALGEASCLSKYRWSNDSVSILQSKLDNDFSSQGMNTFTTDVANDYEAMIARLEERLIDANGYYLVQVERIYFLVFLIQDVQILGRL